MSLYYEIHQSSLFRYTNSATDLYLNVVLEFLKGNNPLLQTIINKVRTLRIDALLKVFENKFIINLSIVIQKTCLILWLSAVHRFKGKGENRGKWAYGPLNHMVSLYLSIFLCLSMYISIIIWMSIYISVCKFYLLIVLNSIQCTLSLSLSVYLYQFPLLPNVVCGILWARKWL